MIDTLAGKEHLVVPSTVFVSTENLRADRQRLAALDRYESQRSRPAGWDVATRTRLFARLSRTTARRRPRRDPAMSGA